MQPKNGTFPILTFELYILHLAHNSHFSQAQSQIITNTEANSGTGSVQFMNTVKLTIHATAQMA